MPTDILEVAKNIKTLADKADPDWEALQSELVVVGLTNRKDIYSGQRGSAYRHRVAMGVCENEAEFIAHSRSAAPQLADAVVELSGQLSALREQVAALQAERREIVEALKFIGYTVCENRTNPDAPTSDDIFRDRKEKIDAARALLAKLGADLSKNREVKP